MNKSKNEELNHENERELKYTKRIIEILDHDPKGMSFTEIKRTLENPDSTPDRSEIRDSTLDRNLKRLIAENKISKSNKKYFPTEGDIQSQIFSDVMDEIDEAVRILHHAGASKSTMIKNSDVNTQKLHVALIELLGTQGQPPLYNYFKNAEKFDILSLVRLLSSIQESRLPDFAEFSFSLADFIRRCPVINGMNADNVLKKEIQRLEEKFFSSESIENIVVKYNGVSDEIKKTAWYAMYECLSNLNGNYLSGILDRFIKIADPGTPYVHNGNDDSSATIQRRVIVLIRNELWNQPLKETLSHRQREFFEKQKEKAVNSEVSLFYHRLREIIVTDKVDFLGI
jgi:hypothetical protein